MRKLTSWVLLLLFCTAEAEQPSAPMPIAAPVRKLPWAQLNFLHTTDTHGWLGGHIQEYVHTRRTRADIPRAQYAADWGDYISFVKHMREKADKDGKDLLLVDTGDRVDGNGLYDGSSPKGIYTSDIFSALDVNIATIGNHELYKNVTIEREYTTIVPQFKGNYIASNVDVVDPKSGDRVPLAQRYRKFKTKNQGINVLAFGFIFDFKGNAKNSWVQPVKETIKEKWFQEALREKDIDLIVVAGHVAVRGEEYATLFQEIRSVKWDVPIQFFGGHLHVRDAVKFDNKATAIASGRFLETVGFLSIDGLPSNKNTSTPLTAGPSFQRMYIDNNLFSYYEHSGRNETSFVTKEGLKISKEIAKARKKMDLDDTYGCAPQSFWVNRASYPSNNSIFSWLDQKVLPEKVVNKDRKDKEHIIFINSGGIRFDIFQGPFTKDSLYIVCPFDSHFVYLQDVPYSAAKRILELLNHGPTPFNKLSLDPTELGPSMQRDVRFVERQRQELKKRELALHRLDSQTVLDDKDPSVPLTPGYTTQDDFGNDGDDTIHSPIAFHPAPNAIQASVGFKADSESDKSKEPDSVDVIFFDFVQPYIILALQFLGQDYKASDVKPYMGNETLGVLMADWASEHWNMRC